MRLLGNALAAAGWGSFIWVLAAGRRAQRRADGTGWKAPGS